MTLLFVGGTPSNWQLWQSDGTALGTAPVTDLFPTDFGGLDAFDLVEVNGTLFFYANDGAGGSQLWTSDGTSAGTFMLTDFQNDYIWEIANDTSTLFFSTNGADGFQLWKSDGTAPGTVLLYSFGNDVGDMYYFAGSGPDLYFVIQTNSGDFQLWTSDGSPSGTTMVKDFQNSAIWTPVDVNGEAYFPVNDGGTWQLWKSNATADGTTLVIDLPLALGPGDYPGDYPGDFPSIQDMTSVNGLLFFDYTHTLADGTGHSQLWVSDGTVAGTVPLMTFNENYSLQSVAFNNELYFIADDGSAGPQLWKSDGTVKGTVRVTDISGGVDLRNLTSANGLLYFDESTANGYVIWQSDGTTAGTAKFAVLPAGTQIEPTSLTGINSTLSVDLGDSTLNGTVGKIPNQTLSSAVDYANSGGPTTNSGKIVFTDQDTAARPMASVDTADETVMYTGSGGQSYSLTDAEIAAIEGGFVVSAAANNTNDGTINWTYGIANRVLSFLGAGETITLTVPVVISDNSGGSVTEDVTVTIHGANDAPDPTPLTVLVQFGHTLTENASDGLLEEHADSSINHPDPNIHDHLTITKVDGQTKTVGKAVHGLWGTLTLNADGSYTYIANPANPHTPSSAVDVFTYTVSDQYGAQTTSTLTIDVSSSRQNPSVSHGVDYRVYSGTATNGMDLSAISQYDGFGPYSYTGGTEFVATYLGTASDVGYLRSTPDAALFADDNLSVVSIFERTPTYAGYFTKAQADSDVADALAAAKLAGQPTGTAIYFTVDYNAPPNDLGAIEAYFEEVRRDLNGTGYALGVYGPGRVLSALTHDPSVKPDYTWLAEAWGTEGFRGENIAQVYDSSKNHPLIIGTSAQGADLDTAFTQNFGQWYPQQA